MNFWGAVKLHCLSSHTKFFLKFFGHGITSGCSEMLCNRSFSSKYSQHHKSQTVRDRDLKFWHNVHYQSWDMCHVAHVTCHVSHVIFFIGGASRWRVCYQQGLPRLVYSIFPFELSSIEYSPSPAYSHHSCQGPRDPLTEADNWTQEGNSQVFGF